jgi:hypothetical protein
MILSKLWIVFHALAMILQINQQGIPIFGQSCMNDQHYSQTIEKNVPNVKISRCISDSKNKIANRKFIRPWLMLSQDIFGLL